MKVLFINSVCGVGSTGRICTDLADVLEKNGNEVKIAYGRKTNGDTRGVCIGTKRDVYLHALFTLITDLHGNASKKYTKRFVTWIEEYDPDIIHIHNIHGYYLNYEILFDYIKKNQKKVVWTLHDCWAFTGHCSYYSTYGCEQWKSGCKQCANTLAYPKSFNKCNVFRNYLGKRQAFQGVNNMRIVTPSKWLACEVKESFLKNYPVEAIYNGIDLSVFKPTIGNIREKYKIGNKKIILGVANIWSEHKGFEDFIELAKHIDKSYCIVLVGLSKSQIKIAEENNIIGIQKTENVKELAGFYSEANVFVNPSKQETLGMVTIEALACGTPVIVYNLTALPETVNEKVGRVVLPGVKNIISSLPAISKLKAEDCMQQAARFEKEKQYNKYLRIYNELMEK